jgi:peptide/nickel transport system permease protein
VRKHSWPAWIGGTLVSIFLLAALFGPVLAPFGPLTQTDDAQYVSPSGEHYLGTDKLGRDVYSRVLYGARTSLLIAIGAMVFALTIAVPLGLLTGYAGGWWDTLVMRGVDIMLAFPSILLAIIFMVALDPTRFDLPSETQNFLRFLLLTFVIGLVNVPSFTRVIRASVMTEREKDYVTASRALGAGPVRITMARILPNILGPIIVITTLGFGTAILEAAGLGFLGLGPQPDSPEWGTALNQARQQFVRAPWVAYAPGLSIVAVVLGFNLLGDKLRDKLDPKSKRR